MLTARASARILHKLGIRLRKPRDGGTVMGESCRMVSASVKTLVSLRSVGAGIRVRELVQRPAIFSVTLDPLADAQ